MPNNCPVVGTFTVAGVRVGRRAAAGAPPRSRIVGDHGRAISALGNPRPDDRLAGDARSFASR
jgi:hypothetical protein